MTTVEQKAGTIGEFMAEFRDAISAIGWTLDYDDTNGDDPITDTTFGSENYLYFGGSTAKEHDYYVQLRDNGDIQWRYGKNYSGPSNFDNYYNSYYSLSPRQGSANFDSGGGDNVVWWLGHSSGEGWWTYISGEEGDSNDSVAFAVAAELSYIWDITTANNVEGGYANTLEEENNTDSRNQPVRSDRGYPSTNGNGLRNSDANYDNFVFWPTNIIASELYQDNNGRETPFGYHDLLIRDQSQGRTAHLDEIDAGTETYILFSDGLNNKWGVKKI